MLQIANAFFKLYAPQLTSAGGVHR
jgi:hypothetical protein